MTEYSNKYYDDEHLLTEEETQLHYTRELEEYEAKHP